MSALKGIHINSIGEMQAYAASLAAIVKVGDCITLQGDLGAGKTTFTRALINQLTDKEIGVTSPTFNLSQSYEVMLEDRSLATLWHFDLYRIEDVSELDELGMEDALEAGVTVIEWPEIILEKLPQERISIVIEFGESSQGRDLILEVPSPQVRQRIEEAGLYAGYDHQAPA